MGQNWKMLVLMAVLLNTAKGLATSQCGEVSIESPVVVLGSSVTASCEIGDNCTFFDGQDIQIEWRLNDDLIPKSQYTNQSSRKSNLTIPCFNTTQGYLSCFVVLHGQAQLVDVIQITAGYPPSKPSDLNCKTNLTEPVTFSCTWNPGRETNLPTQFTLHKKDSWLSCTKSFGTVSIPCKEGHSCTILRKDFHLYHEMEISVTAHNALGNNTSESICLDSMDVVKLDPPIIVSVNASQDKCLEIEMEMRKPEWLPANKCSAKLRYKQAGDLQWTVEQPKKMGGGTLRQCGLLHGTEYQFQVQVTFGAGHWSEWSIEKTGCTHESAPSGKLDVWWKVRAGESERSTQVQLFWKPANQFRANGKNLLYTVFFQTSTGIRNPLCSTSELHCAFLQPEHVNRVYITASNTAGESVPTEVCLYKKRALESPVSISASLSDDHSLWIQWEAPKSLPVTGYVIEWCVVSETLPCHISFTLVQHNCIKTLITENIEPFKCYKISVYPKYKDGFGLPVSVEAYSKQRAPSKVPKLKVEDIGGSYAELAWDSVPVDERNGFIRRYTIFYSDKEGKTGMRVVDAPEMRVTLENLKPSSEYKAFIMVSTDAGSLNGTVLTLSTTILDHWSVISTILPACIGLTLFLLITASACFIKHDNLKLNIWPMVPDPANSSICKWTPPSTQKMNPRLPDIKDLSTSNFSKVSVLDVSAKMPEEKDQKQIGKAEEAGSRSQGNSSGLGESIQDSVFYSSSDDMSPRAYQNTPRVEYSSVVCNGYKGQQNPKHKYLRSDSTQPLLHDLSPSPNQCENIWFQAAKEEVSKACQDEEPGEKVRIASWDDFPLLRGLMINEEAEKDSAP